MWAPFCSVPPIGINTVRVPCAMRARSSGDVIASMRTGTSVAAAGGVPAARPSTTRVAIANRPIPARRREPSNAALAVAVGFTRGA
jgi:hypothetical protein